MSGIANMLEQLEATARSIGKGAGTQPAEGSDGDPLSLAIADVASHYGKVVVPLALVSGLPLVDGKLPLEHMEPAARRAGLKAECTRCDPLRLADVELPVIALMRDGSADVLWSMERDAKGAPAAVLASAPGSPQLRARIAAAEFGAAASSVIVRLRPLEHGDGRAGEPTAGSGRSWFLSAFMASRRVYAEAIAATIAINLLALGLPLFMMNVYDRVLPNAATETLWSLTIGMGLVIAFDATIKVLRGRFVDIAGRRADVLLSNFVYGRLLGARLDGPSASAGVRANTIRELDTLRDFYNSATLTAFGDLPFLLLFIGMIAAIAGPLALIPLLAIPIVLAIGWLTQRAVGRLMEASLRHAAVKNAVVVETVAGLESIKTAAAEGWAAIQWEKATAASARTGNDIKHLTNLGVYVVHAAQTLTQVVMIVVGFYMAAAGALTMGALIAATMLAGRAMQPLAQLAMLVARLHQTRLSFRLLSDIVEAPQERPDGAQFVSMPAISGSIALDRVSFRYEKQGPAVLAAASFAIRAGEHVGIVGGIGSGKSTVLRLLHGLKSPDEGRVLVDGIPVSQIDPAVLRTSIGLALQHTDLFHGTIRTNIALSSPAASDDEVLEAARLAGALDWIVRLPNGLDTQVRERGDGLSGGQRQTIALARALLRRPRLLLLDEPSSDLDPQTELAIVERLRPWIAGRTLLVVTHRPAMLGLVDRLIVLEGGKVRLDGPKATVLASLAAGAGVATAKVEPRQA